MSDDRPMQGLRLYRVEVEAYTEAYAIASSEREAELIINGNRNSVISDCMPDWTIEARAVDATEAQGIIERGEDEGTYSRRDVQNLDLIEAAKAFIDEESLKPPPEDPRQVKMFGGDE